MDFEGKQQSLLTFRVGPVLCCAPSLPVRSIITPPKLTHIAGSDTSQPGIFKHGSHIVKVLDLRQKFGIDASEQTHPGNLIICILEKDGFAFWVDQILDVFDFPTEGWGSLPAAIPRGVFSRTLLLNKKIHLYSEFQKLATINDLGYLEHYIQQLTDNEKKKSITGSSHETSSIKPAIKKQTNDVTSHTTVADEKIKPNVEIKKPSLSSSTTATAKYSASLKTDDKIQTSTANRHSVSSSSLSSQLNKKPVTKTHASIKTPDKITATSTSVSRGVTAASVTSTGVTSSTSQNTIKQTHQQNTFSNTTNKVVNTSQPNIPSFSSTKTSSEKYVDEESNTSNIGVIIFFILLLLLPAVGIYYFLMEDTPKPYKYKMVQEPELTEKTLDSDSVIKPLTQQVATETSSVTESVIDTTEETSTSSVEAMPYRADITQQDDEITITIHQPTNEESKESEEEVPQQPIKQEATIATEEIDEEKQTEARIASTPIKSLQEDELNDPLPAKEMIREVIHTVVKGDTLWAIAKKYVNNPFLYPELARLSNIKNPHRIYPGNRVRIRFIKN